MNRRKWLALPGVLWLLLFMLLPLGFILQVSFRERDVYGTILPEWTIQNYIRFFDPLYIRILIETTGLSLLTVLLCLLLAYPTAYYIATCKPGLQRVLLILVMLPFWVNFLVRTYAWMILLRSQGVIAQTAGTLGLADPKTLTMLYTPGAVLLGMVYTVMPFMVLPLYVALERMDRRLLEAAYDLGANKRRAFLRITLPQTIPGITAGSLITFVTSFGLFVIPDLLGGAKSAMFSNVIQNQFLSARDWPFGAALAVMMVAMTLLLLRLYFAALGASRKGAARHG